MSDVTPSVDSIWGLNLGTLSGDFDLGTSIWGLNLGTFIWEQSTDSQTSCPDSSVQTVQNPNRRSPYRFDRADPTEYSFTPSAYSISRRQLHLRTGYAATVYVASLAYG